MGQPSVVQQSLKRRLGGKCEGGERCTLYIQRRSKWCEEGRRVCLCPAPLSDCVTSNWGHHAPPSNTAWQKLVATLAQTYLQGNPEGNTSLTD